MSAAAELAQTGECDPQEIYGEARQLEQRMEGFIARVERRRALLDMSVGFYTHTKEVGLVVGEGEGGGGTGSPRSECPLHVNCS